MGCMLHRFILFVIFEFFADKIDDAEIDSIDVQVQTVTYCISLRSQKQAFSKLNIGLQFKQIDADKAYTCANHNLSTVNTSNKPNMSCPNIEQQKQIDSQVVHHLS